MTIIDEHKLSRAGFLKGGGALVVGIALPGFARTAAADAAGTPGKWPTPDPSKLSTWLSVNADNTITAHSGKVELGGGTTTGIPQIIAEELDVPVDAIHLVSGDTASCPVQGPTYGSQTIAAAGPEFRQTAADARATLLDMAAQHLGVPAGRLTVRDGKVSAKGSPGKSVTYGELVGGKVLGVTIPVKKAETLSGYEITGRAKPKKPSAYGLVGKSIPRRDIPPKVTGEFRYVHDVKVPGMLHGRVIHPTGIGSKLLGHGKPPKGVKVVRMKDFLGVVSDDEWAAVQAAQNLKVRWSDWKGLPKQSDLHDYLRKTPSQDQVIFHHGQQVESALKAADKTMKATYLSPIETHGSLGPSCAVADVRDGSATVWSGTQEPFVARKAVAQVLKIPENRVRIINYDAAGCYGRNGADPVTVEAALMSQLAGRPVRLQWMRWDEHGWDPKGPATVQDLYGGVDGDGKIAAWDHQAWIPTTYDITLYGTVLAGRTTRVPSKGGWSGPLVYRFPSSRQLAHGQTDLAAHQTGTVGMISAWLRSPAQFQLTFGMESFLDELAAATNADPLQFRLSHTDDKRYAACLRRVAKMAGWDSRPSPSGEAKSGKTVVRGRGIAGSLRDGTYNAEVADVEVNRDTGKIRVNRFYVVQDNGLTINPRAVKLGIEACVVQSTSRVLLEEVTFDRSKVTSLDWRSYPILTFEDTPEVVVDVIDRPEVAATGSGEPSACPVPAAIGNAVFDATGVRIRQWPMRPDRVKEAMKV